MLYQISLKIRYICKKIKNIYVYIYIYIQFFFQLITPAEQQHVMEAIEDNTEKLALLQKTLALYFRQQQRDQAKKDLIKKQKEEEYFRKIKEGSRPTPPSQLDLEDSHRRSLINDLKDNSDEILKPAVKFLTNIQGNTLTI